MLNFHHILFLFGLLLVVLGVSMGVPALADYVSANPDWRVFLVSGVITVFVGIGLFLSNRGAHPELSKKEAFLLTFFVWAGAPLFASLPFAFSALGLSETDSYFEAISGLTTTGSTILTNLDAAPPGILLWRSILQWVGGVGIIVMAVAVLPMLKVGGMQLFKTESSDPSDKILPRITQVAGAILMVYVILTLFCFVGLEIAGMPTFDAINHAMTTVSTGGYSTSDHSIGRFDSAVIDYVTAFFMFVSALPFLLYVQLLRGRPFLFWQDDQVRTFTGLVAIFIVTISAWLWLAGGVDFQTALRLGTFNTISIITTTGYVSAPYDTWGQFAILFFLFVMFLGGCAGSSTGGVKAYRVRILFSRLWATLKQLSMPHGVFRPLFNGRPLPEGVGTAVMGFLLLFAVTFIVITFLLALTGIDFLTALSGALTSLSNTGPGLGQIIGPAGNYSSLPDLTKWVLAFAMILGRLELFTVFVLFTPSFWRA